jgi:hypothetical protein
MSEIVVAPSATATAMSTSTRPGSCRARGRRRQRLGQLAGRRSPIRDIGQQPRSRVRHHPSPSAVTVIFGRAVVACTSDVPLRQGSCDFSNHSFPCSEALGLGAVASIGLTPLPVGGGLPALRALCQLLQE